MGEKGELIGRGVGGCLEGGGGGQARGLCSWVLVGRTFRWEPGGPIGCKGGVGFSNRGVGEGGCEIGGVGGWGCNVRCRKGGVIRLSRGGTCVGRRGGGGKRSRRGEGCRREVKVPPYSANR